MISYITDDSATGPNATHPLGRGDVDWAGALLGRAFLGDPMLEWIIGNSAEHERLVRWFVTASLRYGIVAGRAVATADRDGVAFWLPPGHTSLTLTGMWRSGMLSAPYHLGLAGFGRFMKMASTTDRVHKRHASGPHVYLFGMGVDPSRQGRGIGRNLVTTALREAAGLGVPCYLETQNPKNVPFYERSGFVVVEQSAIGGFTNWAMMNRIPR